MRVVTLTFVSLSISVITSTVVK